MLSTHMALWSFLNQITKKNSFCLLPLLLIMFPFSHWNVLLALSGCLLTIILLMRALDPLGYEKETLAHFQTLKVSTRRVWHWQEKSHRSLTKSSHFHPQEVDSMRSAYYSDLCSKFMIENTILKMEYAEVRVFSISDKVCSELYIEGLIIGL